MKTVRELAESLHGELTAQEQYRTSVENIVDVITALRRAEYDLTVQIWGQIFNLEPETLSTADYEAVLAGHRALVRELDVLLNGEEGAAKQASLCDIVSQLSTLPQPVLAHCKP